MNLWKVRVRTYLFGVRHYNLFVLACTESEMLKTVYSHPPFRKDEDAEIECYEQVDLNGKENRVL